MGSKTREWLWVIALVTLGLCVARQSWINQQIADMAIYAAKTAQQTAALPQTAIAELPDDGQAYHVSLLLHQDWRTRKQERELVAAFDSDPFLRSLKSQVHFHVYPETSSIYRTRLRAAAPDLPCVLVQRATGEVLLKVSGTDATADRVAGPLWRLWKARPIYVCPWRRPQPCPDPKPEPEPEPDADLTPIPDLDQTHTPDSALPWWVVALAALAGAALPIGQHLLAIWNRDVE